MTDTLKSVVEDELQKAYERGVRDGMKREHALWQLAKIGQEIEAQPEPVAWVDSLNGARPDCVTDFKYLSVTQVERGDHLKYIPLYADPTQRKPLTNNDLCEILDEWNDADEIMIELCRRIEAAHGITGDA